MCRRSWRRRCSNPSASTGAGDIFAGVFASAWARAASPVAAVRCACVAGALATPVLGAAASAPSEAQIDRLERAQAAEKERLDPAGAGI
ncbi:PfkB family carbohydrate kinase [Dactylosporangium sp. NPDC000244]|uniref:PfkB family carbohydrate kinase n=1 Tax=Dactylosporangium sp. NPDC000244 TaxID=3154365 RepID=UPI00331B453A